MGGQTPPNIINTQIPIELSYSSPIDPLARQVVVRMKLSVLGTSGDHLGPSGTSGDHLGTIWDMDSMKLSISLRNRTFRSARIDPSSLPKHRRTNLMKNNPYKKKQ